MRSNRRAKLPSQYVLVFQGILFVACLSSVCTEDVDWESLYGATKGEDPCTGDNAPMECSIRHDSLFGRAEDDSQQHGGAESERVAELGQFHSEDNFVSVGGETSMPAEKLAERLVAARATQQQSADEIYARAVSGAQDTSPSESQRIAEADGVGWETMYGAVNPEDPCGVEDAPMECSARPGRLFGVSADDAALEGNNQPTASSIDPDDESQQETKYTPVAAETTVSPEKLAEMAAARAGGRSLSGDELYAQEAGAAQHAAISTPLVTFASGTAEVPSEEDGPAWARAFARRRRRWDHHMELAVAVAAPSPVTAQAVVPLQLGRLPPIAVAVGDEGGTVMLLHPSGQLLVEFDVGGGAITAVEAMPVQRLQAALLTGHADGSVRTHTLHLAHSGHGDDAGQMHDTAAHDIGLRAEDTRLTITSVDPNYLILRPTAHGGGNSKGGGGGAIKHLLTLRQGREARFAAIQASGDITVWRQDGYQLQRGHCGEPVLAARWSDASITMLTPTGAAAFLTHLLPGAPAPVVRAKECTGLGEGGARLAAAAFDVQQPVHVFGATLDGRLLQLTLGNPKTFLHCRVVQEVPLGLGPQGTLSGGITMVALQQHIITASSAWVAVWDVRRRGAAPRRLFDDSTGVISASLRVQKPLEAAPVMVAGRVGPVAVGLEAGVVASYLPFRLAFDAEPDFSFFEMWSRPLVTAGMVVAAAWQVARARRRARRRREAVEDAATASFGGATPFQPPSATLQAALGVNAKLGAAARFQGEGEGDEGDEDDDVREDDAAALEHLLTHARKAAQAQ